MRRLSDRRPARVPGIAARATGDGVVLGHGEDAWALNHTAALVWSLCDGTRTTPAIVGEVAEAFGETRRRVAGDVARAIRDLVRLGCVRV